MIRQVTVIARQLSHDFVGPWEDERRSGKNRDSKSESDNLITT